MLEGSRLVSAGDAVDCAKESPPCAVQCPLRTCAEACGACSTNITDYKVTFEIMLEITCTGSPHEIGFQHGKAAAAFVRGSLIFYTEYFQRKSNMDWRTAEAAAEKFMPFLGINVPELVEEMRGLAEGVALPLSSILALNVRSEISMGMMSEGCTSLAWKTDHFSLAAEIFNLKWEDVQKKHLIILNILRSDDARPRISQVTEAGIIGKIGLNSAGVAVCLNAIRTPGVDFEHLPVHLALRLVLECASRIAAISRLRELGVVSAVHMLVVDSSGTTSMEFSAIDIVSLEMRDGQIAHTNHFLAKHADGVAKSMVQPDSRARMARVSRLLQIAAAEMDTTGSIAVGKIQRILEDEDGFPTSINRKSSPGNASSTLFSIVTDLQERTAVVQLGRPTEDEGTFTLHM